VRRRSFLRKLTGAAAAVVAAPSLPAASASPRFVGIDLAAGADVSGLFFANYMPVSRAAVFNRALTEAERRAVEAWVFAPHPSPVSELPTISFRHVRNLLPAPVADPARQSDA